MKRLSLTLAIPVLLTSAMSNAQPQWLFDADSGANGEATTIEGQAIHHGDVNAPVVLVEGTGLENVFYDESIPCTADIEGALRWTSNGDLESCISGEWTGNTSIDAGMVIGGSNIHHSNGLMGQTRQYTETFTIGPMGHLGINVRGIVVNSDTFSLADASNCIGNKVLAGQTCSFTVMGSTDGNVDETLSITARGHYVENMVPTSGSNDFDVNLRGWCDTPKPGLVSSNVCGMMGNEIVVVSATDTSYNYSLTSSISRAKLNQLSGYKLPTVAEAEHIAKYDGYRTWSDNGSSTSRVAVDSNGNETNLRRTTSSYTYSCPKTFCYNYNCCVRWMIATGRCTGRQDTQGTPGKDCRSISRYCKTTGTKTCTGSRTSYPSATRTNISTQAY
jgi:hypothetical protein